MHFKTCAGQRQWLRQDFGLFQPALFSSVGSSIALDNFLNHSTMLKSLLTIKLEVIINYNEPLCYCVENSNSYFNCLCPADAGSHWWKKCRLKKSKILSKSLSLPRECFNKYYIFCLKHELDQNSIDIWIFGPERVLIFYKYIYLCTLKHELDEL